MAKGRMTTFLEENPDHILVTKKIPEFLEMVYPDPLTGGELCPMNAI